MDRYEHFFQTMTGGMQPHGWQTGLAGQSLCANLMLRIVTGFGKTFGALGAWTWHRVVQNDDAWPRRLVWCLPMRVLVEQTEQEVRAALTRLNLLWEGGDHAGKVGVHLLMGGADSGQWHLYPEHCAVLIGTQDMLLSRALNRGYACSRARWPVEFGLLHQDALWVLDEVQLMDVGLATSAQIQAFRDDDAMLNRSLRPCRTWWMSATLQPEWLAKSPDTAQLTKNLPRLSIEPEMRVGRLWDDVRKPCSREVAGNSKDIAGLTAREHLAMDRSQSGPTLVVVNTVKTAVEVFKELKKVKDLSSTDIRLVHSRFRPRERTMWRDAFLNKNACAAGTNRIIVATQVVEAGVDLSASLLITELAIWASLVQRFGRAARWGGVARIIIVDLAAALGRQAREKATRSGKKDVDLDAKAEDAETRAALPYALEEIRAAREALDRLNDVSPQSLEAFEETHPELLPRLYPYEPKHLLLRHEMDELFDTSPDLSGADIDISRFIRSGDERDVQIFWENIAPNEEPADDSRPTREALCSVPFLAAREWLCGKGQRLQDGKRAWVWDWVEGAWRKAESRDFYPGQTVLVAADSGGYNPTLGWDGDSKQPVEPVPEQPPAVDRAMDLADAAQDSEALSRAAWQTIAFHCGETARILDKMTKLLSSDLVKPVSLAGRSHDGGKALSGFQGRIMKEDEHSNRQDLAKAPDHAWAKDTRSRGLRHELASVLALLAVLQRHAPDHLALLGPWRDLLQAAGMPPADPIPPENPPTAIEREILDLSADQFNLFLYLVCAHHGKVRMAWHATRFDQERAGDGLRIQGVRDGETLPDVPLLTKTGEISLLPGCVMDLTPASAGLNPRTGQGWTERVLSLLNRFGPFTLAWLEAIIRSADQRASMASGVDPLLHKEG
ncbi:MAG: DEAD/DEAH box helicase [Desulfovibrionales bacterium]|nr:MAG: DEAD/DEAH box helicase [Desulfovibrionales bacterium]